MALALKTSDQEEEIFKPHSTKQDDLIMSRSELTIAATGTQWGKSQGAAIWMKLNTHIFNDKSDRFLILAPTYKIMQQSTLPYFLNYMQGYGRHRQADAEFLLNSGGIVYFRTLTDPDSMVGIPRTRAFWLDEAGKATLYAWENIQARAASVGALGLLTTSPYSRNWLYKDYMKPHLLGKQKEDTHIIRAASWENPYHSFHDPEKREKSRRQMDPRRFDMLYGGEWGQMTGLVYDCFDDEENVIDPFELPAGTKFYGGIDWGFNPDPFVLKIRAITPEGRHYSINEFYKTGMAPTDIVELCKQKQHIYGVKFFYCDPSQPGYIEELNRNKITAIAANNDISQGIGRHYELMKSRRYKCFRGSNQHTIDEYETYHYPEPEDLGPDDNSKETKPVDQNNHCMDAERYISMMTYSSHIRRQPHVPEQNTSRKNETYEQRYKRLTKLKRQDDYE